ncbi:hypothetical protein [Streptomyces sp. NPDC004296]|uniref:hypothetical protein n=1 Tax=Streptomyces sp. NPDC004296 TaxID=3364697 RepID=UPI0036B1D40F
MGEPKTHGGSRVIAIDAKAMAVLSKRLERQAGDFEQFVGGARCCRSACTTRGADVEIVSNMHGRDDTCITRCTYHPL